MVNIPLIQGNSIQDINTSIIAIKKAQKELETLNTQIDNKIKALNLALSGGPGKYIESIQEVQGLIKVTEGSITDTIASGNSQPITSNAVSNILAFSSFGRTLGGADLQTGIIIRVMFTTQQTGSNTTSAMQINYNGTNYNVKATKNGSLVDFVANNINGTYIYCQAYTTLELMFDGTQFIIMGNPVVISSADYTIYTDGFKTNGMLVNKFDSVQQSNMLYSLLSSLGLSPSSNNFGIVYLYDVGNKGYIGFTYSYKHTVHLFLNTFTNYSLTIGASNSQGSIYINGISSGSNLRAFVIPLL